MLRKFHRSTQRFVAATTFGGMAMMGMAPGGCEEMGESFSRGLQAGFEQGSEQTSGQADGRTSFEQASGDNAYTWTGDAEDVNIDPYAFDFGDFAWFD